MSSDFGFIDSLYPDPPTPAQTSTRNVSRNSGSDPAPPTSNFEDDGLNGNLSDDGDNIASGAQTVVQDKDAPPQKPRAGRAQPNLGRAESTRNHTISRMDSEEERRLAEQEEAMRLLQQRAMAEYQKKGLARKTVALSQAEAERRRQIAEQQAAMLARQKAEQQAMIRKRQEEAAKKKATEEQAAAARKRAEQEAARQREEEQRKVAEEAAKLKMKMEEEERKKKAQEAERRHREEEERRRREEAELQRLKEEEERVREEEERRRVEEERQREEEEQEEKRRRAQEEEEEQERKRILEEEEEERRAAEDAKREQERQLAEARKRAYMEEAKRMKEEERRLREEEEEAEQEAIERRTAWDETAAGAGRTRSTPSRSMNLSAGAGVEAELVFGEAGGPLSPEQASFASSRKDALRGGGSRKHVAKSLSFSARSSALANGPYLSPDPLKASLPNAATLPDVAADLVFPDKDMFGSGRRHSRSFSDRPRRTASFGKRQGGGQPELSADLVFPDNEFFPNEVRGNRSFCDVRSRAYRRKAEEDVTADVVFLHDDEKEREKANRTSTGSALRCPVTRLERGKSGSRRWRREEIEGVTKWVQDGSPEESEGEGGDDGAEPEGVGSETGMSGVRKWVEEEERLPAADAMEGVRKVTPSKDLSLGDNSAETASLAGEVFGAKVLNSSWAEAGEQASRADQRTLNESLLSCIPHDESDVSVSSVDRSAASIRGPEQDILTASGDKPIQFMPGVDTFGHREENVMAEENKEETEEEKREGDDDRMVRDVLGVATPPGTPQMTVCEEEEEEEEQEEENEEEENHVSPEATAWDSIDRATAVRLPTERSTPSERTTGGGAEEGGKSALTRGDMRRQEEEDGASAGWRSVSPRQEQRECSHDRSEAKEVETLTVALAESEEEQKVPEKAVDAEAEADVEDRLTCDSEEGARLDLEQSSVDSDSESRTEHEGYGLDEAAEEGMAEEDDDEDGEDLHV